MKIMIMGMDGYLGWTLAMYLSGREHDVCGVDNMSRRRNVNEIGSWSATPIRPIEARVKAYEEATGRELRFYEGDLTHSDFVDLLIERERPETIVHLGEMPSAPYSMIDVQHCNYTQVNNIIGNNNILFAMKRHATECHLLKLGAEANRQERLVKGHLRIPCERHRHTTGSTEHPQPKSVTVFEMLV